MNRPFGTSRRRGAGYTLVELLMAITLTLIMMRGVVQIFSLAGEAINDARAGVELAGRVRGAIARLQRDLDGMTAPLRPPLRPEEGKGYFAYFEGGPPGGNDLTLLPTGDILRFTARSRGEPFVGQWVNPASGKVEVLESYEAEIAWFVRGNTLQRHVWLIAPWLNASGASLAASRNYISMNPAGMANTLADLTTPENRSQFNPNPNGPPADHWTEPPSTGITGDYNDIVLNNVIGFDVKVWDPQAPGGGTYADLGTSPGFSGGGNVYDTWTTRYGEKQGGSDGFAGAGAVVDGPAEQVPPPYPAPIRGIQVRIRSFEADTRHIRQGTLIYDATGK